MLGADRSPASCLAFCGVIGQPLFECGIHVRLAARAIGPHFLDGAQWLIA
jgi:hypothetical protein